MHPSRPGVPMPARRALCFAVGVALAPLAAAAAAAAEPPAASATDLDRVQVLGQRYLPDYAVRKTRSATKTDTALRDVPQAITVVTDKLIADQAITSLAELTRYMPGVGIAQGEGNRDTPVFRGNSSTADFFVDGIRDDVQYIRDVYNIERAEALKGPNAMIFGRGGTGGLINRVTRQADGLDHRGGSLMLGAGQRRRTTLDYGIGWAASAGLRLNAVYEDSQGYRDGFQLKRYGVNPSFGVDLGPQTRLQLSAEHFRDARVADRGVPSYLGRPLATDPGAFFGNPELSPVRARVNAFDAVIDHRFAGGLELRNHLRLADYDKFYQNVFPGAVDAAGETVAISAYNQGTQRRNLFNQTDLVWHVRSGSIQHTLMGGVELGRQATDNLRLTGYFGPAGSTTPTTVQAPLTAPRAATPPGFRQSATDADNHGVARVAALYVQDQIEFSPQWQAVLGLRHDDFRVDVRNNRTGTTLRTRDGLLSPRAGLIYKPREEVSVYASYSLAHQPRAGEQLASLSASTQALEPEQFRNRELGAKWDIRPDLAASIAVYRLDRRNVAITDLLDPTWMVLVDGQVARGLELGLAGRITEAWQVMGGYAWQSGEITTSQSAGILAGSRLAQLPVHSASLWNRYDFNARFGAGLGVIHRGSLHPSTDAAVTLPAFTRFDAALYWTLSPTTQLQFNVENLGNKRYFASAHSNNNITPGAPRSAWASVNYRF